jgi:hypothetical protein
VALGGSGWPQRIQADWLWPRRHVATRATSEPVLAAAILSARSNAYKDNGGADRPHRRRVPRRLGVWPAWGDYLDSLGLLGSEGARTGAGGRRGESGAGAGAATATWRWCWRGYLLWSGGARRACEGARWGARACRGDRHGLRPGTDWKRAARRSLGRRHGWRRIRRPQLGSNARGNGSRWRSVHSPVKRAALPTLRPRARGNPPRRGHGGAADRRANWRSGAREGAKGPASPPRLRRACWGARLREGVAARTDARANANTNAPATGHGGGQDGVAPYG